MDSFSYLRQICTAHIGCVGCPLAGRKAIDMGGATTLCLTGGDKPVNDEGTRSDSGAENQGRNDNG